MIYKQIFPTKYPLFDFHINIWKLNITTCVMRPSIESLTYEYITLLIYWGGKEIHRFRLYDSEKRQIERLDGMLLQGRDFTLKQLREIRKVALEEIKKIESNQKGVSKRK